MLPALDPLSQDRRAGTTSEREAPVAEWQPLPPGPEQLQRPGYHSRVATQARYIFNDLDDMVKFLGEI